jgi:hypothetical protein
MSPRRSIQQLAFLLVCLTTMWLTFPKEAEAAQNCDWCMAMEHGFFFEECPNSTPDQAYPTSCQGEAVGDFESETCRQYWRQVFRCYHCPLCNM